MVLFIQWLMHIAFDQTNRELILSFCVFNCSLLSEKNNLIEKVFVYIWNCIGHGVCTYFSHDTANDISEWFVQNVFDWIYFAIVHLNCRKSCKLICELIMENRWNIEWHHVNNNNEIPQFFSIYLYGQTRVFQY